MSWRDAPLYVEASDLATWVVAKTSSWPAERHCLGADTARAAYDLLCATAEALTFPRTRAGHLQEADLMIVRLRTLLRLARSLGWLSGGGLRHAAGRLQAIGRMVGGWRKRLGKAERLGRGPAPLADSGDGPPAA